MKKLKIAIIGLVIGIGLTTYFLCTIGIGIKRGYKTKETKTQPQPQPQPQSQPRPQVMKETIKEFDQDCYCRKVTPFAETPIQNRSTCSQYATDRGPGQKVISFSFYGKLKSAYFNGIAGNLALIPLFYPDYIMRLYLDINALKTEDDYKDLCKLYCSDPNLDLCDVGKIGKQNTSLP